MDAGSGVGGIRHGHQGLGPSLDGPGHGRRGLEPRHRGPESSLYGPMSSLDGLMPRCQRPGPGLDVPGPDLVDGPNPSVGDLGTNIRVPMIKHRVSDPSANT